LYFAQKYLYFSDRNLIFPEVPVISALSELSGYNRVWSYGNAYIEKNFLAYYGLYSPEGYDPLFSQDYGELVNTVRTGGVITGDINRADVDLSPAGEDTAVLGNRYRARLLQLLSVRYIAETKLGERKDALATPMRFPEKDFALAWEDDHFRIWEYKDALPRAVFYSSFEVQTSKQLTADALFDENTDISQKIILQENPFESPDGSQKSDNKGSVIIKSYNPSEIVLESEATASGVVFLSDTYHPDWKAYVDGIETPIIKADYAFRAVAVAAGKHTILMKYIPSYIPLSNFLGISGLVLCIYIIISSKKKL
jgi:hypothetical protein